MYAPPADNGAFYLENGVPFVMGTSGGDRDKLKALVSSRAAEGHGAHAVIAPQMGKQVAAFGAVVNMLGKSFPGAFAGYKLEVRERQAVMHGWCV